MSTASDYRLVFFDLETTDFDHRSRHARVQICQIGAYFQSGKKKFDKYLVPTCPVSPGATRVNKLSVVDGELFKDGKLVKNAQDAREGLMEFMNFLAEEVVKGDEDVKIVLVRNFDAISKSNFLS